MSAYRLVFPVSILAVGDESMPTEASACVKLLHVPARREDRQRQKKALIASLRTRTNGRTRRIRNQISVILIWCSFIMSFHARARP